ncbi:MAG TPA: hemerythrin domain-containing protein [Caulobacteraceae bacterium]|nr:hemerythrin domain-containing protein [Caulobacteraceae bacterium]
MAKSDEEMKSGPEGQASDQSASTSSGGSPPAAKAGQTPDQPSQATRSSKAAQSNGDAIAMLKADHRKAEQLFAEFENADDNRKGQIIDEACHDLIIHTLLEERIFYPAARQPSTEDKLDEAQVEHDAAKVMILELLHSRGRDEYRTAKFKVLAEEIKHHVREEEAADGVFAKAQRAGVNTHELAERLTALKRQLQQKADSGRLPDPEPASFQYFGEASYQEKTMPRERDEYGRFTSDDDDRRYRSHRRDDYDDERSYRSSGSAGRERDAQGRFMSDDDDDRRSYGRSGGRGGWYGDPESHSEASRRGWDERSGSGRSSSQYRERDERGRFMDDDDDRGYRSRGGGRPGGWYGDPEGHSEASRRGWDERGGGRSASGRYEERSYASRSRDDDDGDYRDRSRRGHSGWSGDPEGHAEAARRGWEHRR